MIKCQTCGMSNLDESQFCDECGATLMKNEDGKTDYQTQMSDVPVFKSTNVTSVGIPNIAEVIREAEASLEKNKQQPAAKSVHATLVVERGEETGREFPLTAEESLIGRWDADNGIFPDVDLDRHDPEAKISRRHARILFRGGQYAVEDLGSTNGTFVNRGRRLIPGSAQVLNDGDEIIVGKTFLRLIISR